MRYNDNDKLMKTLNWASFKAQLLQNPDLDLQFQYAANKLVDTSYHITEIKQAPITSVDCGGVMNKWTEVIIQLWEPGKKQHERSMKVSKALAIVNLVEKILPLDANAIVKIEFGNSQFDTRQMYPGNIIADGENLVIDLRPDFTQCKAINRGGSCGTIASDENSPPAIKLNNLVTAATCCEPSSGCC